MANATELLRQGKTKEIWQKYCGFIDLSIDEFMKIQEQLLMEQVELLSKCELGRKIMGDKIPKSVEEFKESVPLTTYDDYAPYLSEKREDILPEGSYMWCHTSGKTGQHKWVPYPKKMYKILGEIFLTSLIFTTSKKRGDFLLNEGGNILYGVAPPPYLSGIAYRALAEEFNVDFIPPLEEAERMDYVERMKEGFKISLIKGIDFFAGASSVLANIGQRFSGKGEKSMISISSLLHPLVMMRIAKALIKSKIARRGILPKDIWRLKGIMSGGVDAEIYGKIIEHYWGVRPLEAYVSTESGIVAMQLWDYGSMTFFPHLNFVEFISEKDSIKSQKDPNYKPRTLFLNEVKPHQIYEVVITNLHGGVFVRYKSDDLIKIISLKNEKLGVDIPQMAFYSRASEVIDLASFARLTERAVWQAIEGSGIKYNEWALRKEIENQHSVLHLYLELKGEEQGEKEIVDAVHESLKKIDPDYNDIEKMLQFKPLRLTILSPGTFQRYMLKKKEEGADLGHIKSPHMNPSDKIIDDLLQLSKQK